MTRGTIWGFDIGSRSIGWTVMGADSDGFPTGEVVDANVVLHAGGILDDKDGTTRRAKRGEVVRGRRRLRRKKARRRDLTQELTKFDFQFQEGWRSRNPWWARATLSSSQVEDPLRVRHLVATALPHMSKHRGWRNPWLPAPRPAPGRIPEDVVKAAAHLSEVSGEVVAKTLGAVCWELMSSAGPTKIRQSGNGKSENQQDISEWIEKVHQEHISSEIAEIWARQSRLHPELFTDESRDALCGLILEQVPPGVPLDRIGKCDLDPSRFRAPKASPLFQENRILGVVANLRIAEPSKKKRPLASSERNSALELLNQGSPVEWTDVADAIGVPVDWLVHADREGTSGRPPVNQVVERLENTKDKSMKDLRKWWESAGPDGREALVAIALSDRTIGEDAPETAQDVASEIENLGLLETVEKFGRALPPGRSSYSRLVLSDLNGVMEQGHDLHRAIEQTYGHGSAEAQVRWDDPVPNAGVEASMKQVRQIVERLESEYGPPAKIGVEIVREASLSFTERNERMARIKRERESREEARICLIKDYGIERPSAGEIAKREHLTAQTNLCLYCGKPLQMGTTELDHIVPRSTGGATIFNNIVAACRPCNQSKGERTFAAWCDDDAEAGNKRMEETLERLKSLGGPRWKTKPSRPYIDPDSGRWVRSERDQAVDQIRKRLKKVSRDREFDDAELQSTAFVSKVVASRLRRRFPDSRVSVIPGGMTAAMRNETKLPLLLGNGEKKDRADRRHHAVDAVAVALLTNDTWATRVRKRNEAYRNHKLGTLTRRRLNEIQDGANIDELLEVTKRVGETGAPIMDAIVPVCPRRLSTTGRIHEDTVRPWVSKALGDSWSAKEISSARDSEVRRKLWEISSRGGSVKADPERTFELDDGTSLGPASGIECARRIREEKGTSTPTATWLSVRHGWCKTDEIHHARLINAKWQERGSTQEDDLLVPLPLVDVYGESSPLKKPLSPTMIGVRAHPKLARILSIDPRARLTTHLVLTQGDVLRDSVDSWEISTFDGESNRAQARPALLGGAKSEGPVQKFVAGKFRAGIVSLVYRDGLGHPIPEAKPL